MTVRMVTVWVPDWPVVAAGYDAGRMAAVMSANRVMARTPAAAAEGVVIGQRRRQTHRRCPDIELIDHDPARDAREFEPVVRAVAAVSPRLDVIEPGWVSMAARGPSKYFGGDAAMAAHLQTVVGVEAGRSIGLGVGERRSGGRGEWDWVSAWLMGDSRRASRPGWRCAGPSR